MSGRAWTRCRALTAGCDSRPVTQLVSEVAACLRSVRFAVRELHRQTPWLTTERTHAPWAFTHTVVSPRRTRLCRSPVAVCGGSPALCCPAERPRDGEQGLASVPLPVAPRQVARRSRRLGPFLLVSVLLSTPIVGRPSGSQDISPRALGPMQTRHSVAPPLRSQARLAFLTTARVWTPTHVSAMDVRAGPPAHDSWQPNEMVT